MKLVKNLIFAFCLLQTILTFPMNVTAIEPEYDSSNFVNITDVDPNIMVEARYYTSYNFVGERIRGYEEPIALATREMAQALKAVNSELYPQGYCLKIYDAYRPQSAVNHFVEWGQNLSDVKMKDYFYPELDKSVLFDQGYIAYRSGHSRGSTVDLTLYDLRNNCDVDMGGTFDYFGYRSHPSYPNVTQEQYSNRMKLRDVMLRHNFRPLDTEWWHFTLNNEPFPGRYFRFPVKSLN